MNEITTRKAKVFNWKDRKYIDTSVPVLSEFNTTDAANGAIFRVPSLHEGQYIELSAIHIISQAQQNNVEINQSDTIRLLEFAIVNRISPALGEMYFFKSSGRLSIGISAEAYLRRANNCPGYMGIETGWIVAPKNGKGRKYLQPNETIDPTWEVIGSWSKAYRKDHKTPIGEALYAEYDKKKDAWSRLKETMIRKVSRSIALRLAFPAQLGSIYTHEEMPDNEEETPPGFEQTADKFNNAIDVFAQRVINEDPVIEEEPDTDDNAMEGVPVPPDIDYQDVYDTAEDLTPEPEPVPEVKPESKSKQKKVDGTQRDLGF